jgi:hypothetical protein
VHVLRNWDCLLKNMNQRGSHCHCIDFSFSVGNLVKLIMGDVAGNLVKLIKGEKAGRRNSDEITVFKSVDSAVVDILASQWVYETYIMLNYITL